MRKLDTLCAVSALALLWGIAPAQAQDAAPESPAAPSEQEPDEVVISGIRQSMLDALGVKRSSDKVVDAISANEIGVLPDVTIAESINRLPGVNATRDRGNDSQAVIRGLGARLVLGTINGREVASSEPDRNIRWEIYPSEVVSGVQVYKSQSADLIAGGVAATVNISTLDPLDYKGPAFVVRAGPVFYDGGKDFPNYNRLGYRASGSLVHKLTDNLAVVLGITAQKQKNGYSSLQGWGYNDSEARPPVGASDYTGDLNGDGTPDPTPWGAQISNTRIDQDRLGVSTGVAWQPTDSFKLKADFLYSDISIEERQDQTVYGQNNWGNWNNGNWGDYNAAGASYTLIDGDVIQATLPYSSVGTVLAKYIENKKLYIGGLNGRWASDGWSVAADLSYSRAQRENAWMAVRTEVYPASTSFDFRADRVPSITTSEDPSQLAQVAQNYRSGTYDAETLDDRLGAIALDVAREFDGDGFVRGLDFGVRGSDRVKKHDAASFIPSVCGPVAQSWMCSSGSVTIPASMFTRYDSSVFDVPTLLTGDVDAIATAAYGANPFDPANAVDEPAERWRVKESVLEGYAKLDFGGALANGSFSGNFGVRLVHVETTSSGNRQDAISGSYTPITVDNDYTYVLPSANLKLDFGEGKILRFAVAKVVARPPLDELRASRTLTQWQPYTGSGGNPNLKPFEATQFDAAFEYYFRPESLIAVSGYYKLVDSYIGWQQTAMTFSGLTYSVSTPVNGSSGYIRGVELTFQTPFFFLGTDSVGIYSNYAFADADLEEYAPANDPLKIVGLARHTAAVDLWYAKNGIELRAGMKHHSPFTVIYGWSGADLQTLEEETTFDVSGSYDLTSNITLRAQVNNLTNEPLRMYRDNKPNRLGRYDVYGRRYLFDVTVKF